MAKSARASSRKANNQKLKRNVFGPVETARTDRLSAKLMELVAQAKPAHEEKKEEEVMEEDPTPSDQLKEEASAMDVDAGAVKIVSSKKRIEKRRSVKKGSIVFPRYKDRKNTTRRK
ncbi:gpi ethanolamine phosphate transferase [Ophiostoma piceae UAMH 11346]|uniref:Gpi ethanolamine phosphate transferase n=1 Tax=Ophiostoma piceae (strain UAMH 11346) TaxID=1262450 RepID=S3CL71_OPHP1|nr:gpi ethanolamine phosphate transferase [Ophiostoma piceae UAMH 11346]